MTNRLVLVLAFLLFLPICAESQAKKAESRPTVPLQACPRLEAQQHIPDGEAGALIKQALRACKDYSARKLTANEWGEQLVAIEEHAAFLNPPPGFAGVIPFSDAGLFQGFDTYSLFLFPSVEWTNKKDEVKALYAAFNSFGDAIGEHRLAIWFTNKNDEVDVRRSKLYCDRFGLDYNNGPYVVTLQGSPAVWRGRPVTISLGGISTDRRVRVLNILEQDLRTSRELTQRPLLFAEIRERLLSAVERHREELTQVIIKLL